MDRHDDAAAACVLALLHDAYQRRLRNQAKEELSQQFILGNEQDPFVIDDLIYKYDIRAARDYSVPKGNVSPQLKIDVNKRHSNESSPSLRTSSGASGMICVRPPSTPKLEINHMQEYLNIRRREEPTKAKCLKKIPVDSYRRNLSTLKDSHFHFYRNEPHLNWTVDSMGNCMENRHNSEDLIDLEPPHKLSFKPMKCRAKQNTTISSASKGYYDGDREYKLGNSTFSFDIEPFVIGD